MYLPPRRANLYNYLQEVQIKKLIAGLSGDKMLIGDINLNIEHRHELEQGQRSIFEIYTDTMTLLGQTLCNDKTTRESSTAILDHVHTNMETIRKIHTATVQCHFIDHSLNFRPQSPIYNISNNNIKSKSNHQTDFADKKIRVQRLTTISYFFALSAFVCCFHYFAHSSTSTICK